MNTREMESVDESFEEANRLLECGEPRAAFGSFSDILARQPDHGMAALGRAIALQDLGFRDDASAIFSQINRDAPHASAARYCHAIDRLRRADLAAGFTAYEAREDYMGVIGSLDGLSVTRAGRRWRGEEGLSGRSILIHWEQGLGDTIQFARYVPLVERAAGQLVFEVQAPLRRLMSSLDSSAILVCPGDEMPEVDFQCPLMSLPHVLGTTLETIPAQIPYLSAEPSFIEEWMQRLGSSNGRLRVGVAWHGNVKNKRDARRSIPLQQFIKALPLGPDYLALQYEIRDGDQLWLMARPDIRYVGHAIQDFSDTAAIISQLDLVITVDTSVAHLAGALGKPVWVLIDYVPDWRWMLDRVDSPWYPTLTLVRQIALGDWSAPLAQVRQALEQHALQNAGPSVFDELKHEA